ncbi:hypothetical protein SAMN04489752_3597 [Brevibacterium siliguriense]|uniref:Glycosyl hydrolase family 79, N-terminal domain n=1 Tax=Brevibacterium siliguriense TaxID=1136497 RepID=A0A1H1Y997_9MICO|nr:hypothetical protein [Brevibacterium siliguriense]SDT18007.1 hypothetical protein SAMN04489752_3597 [Brevibacterium siliguriense]
MALALVLSGCSWSDSDGSSSADQSPEPSPTPTEFEQSFSGDISGDDAVVTATTDRMGPSLAADNVGVSFEATDLADPRLDPAKSNLDEQLKTLGSPALRFGGNALDRRTFWTSKGEKPKHGEKVTITPDDLGRLKKLVDVTGSSVTIGIPLGTYDPARGADMAAHAVDILGDSLVGLAIGNEPNGYTVTDVPSGAVRGKGWNKDKYVKQLEAYAKAIHAKRPKAPIIGPDVYDGAWMDAFARSGVKHKTAISQHWYQLYECDSTQIPGRGPQAANLIDPLANKAAKKNLGIGKSKADAAGLPLWLEETGPTSCPGTNDTSLTNASALWAADYTMYAATLGVERMAMHSMLGACNGGAPMSLICDPADHGDRSNKFQVRPNMLGLRLLVPSVGGHFTKTSVSGGGNMSAYTVVKNDGRTLVMTVINANDAASVGGNPVTVTMPTGFSVSSASQVYGESNDVKSATQVVPANPLPAEVPFSGDEAAGSASASAALGAANSSPAPSDGAGDRKLRIDLAGSSVTVFVMKKAD